MSALRLLVYCLALLPLQVEASDLFTTGPLEYLAGGGLGEDGPALEASLLPQDVLAAPDGSVYLADELYNRVRVVDPEGRLHTVAGDGRYGLDDQVLPARQSALMVPAGLALSPQGQLYIVDLGNRRVCVLGPDGTLRTFMGPDHPLVAGSPNSFAPYGVAADAQGRVLVADRANFRVWQLDPDGRGRPVAGNGLRGFSGDGSPSALARLADPRAVEVGADGSIYIADIGNRRVRRVGPDGRISTLAGDGGEQSWSGRRPARQASLKPVDLAFDLQGRLLILDELGPRLLRLEADSTLAVLAQFELGSQPKALSVDPQGRVLVADYAQRRVAALREDSLLPLAGNGLLRASGEGGPALNASLYQPFGLAFDARGDLYIADRRNHLVRRVRSDGIIERVAGIGLPGFGGDGGSARLAPCNQPSGLAFDAQGNLYIADSGNHRIRKLSPDGILQTIAGTGVPGFGGDGGSARLALLDQPTGLAFDPQGNLYVADSANHRVRRIDPAGAIQTAAGTGQDLPPGEGGPALESALAYPMDLSFGPGNLLFIADPGSHRVYTLDRAGLLCSLAGTGFPGQGLDGTLAARAALNQPLGLVADGAGGVYIADTGNGRLVHVDSDGVLRVLDDEVGRPSRLALDPQGNLVLADIEQHRIARLPVERQLADAGARIRTSFSYQLESEAALSQPGLLELIYQPAEGTLYLTHREGVEELLPARRFFARFQASPYRAVPAPARIGTGLLVATPPALGRSQPLTLIAADREGDPLYFPLPYVSEAPDALASAGDWLYLYQQDQGRLLRLADKHLEICATLPVGPALLEGTPTGALFIALAQSRELFKAEDADGDGQFALRRVALLPERPVALSFGDRLYLGLAGGRLYRLGEGEGLEELASGFAPGLLDLAATPEGAIYALEGDAHSGRLLRLSPPAPQVEAWPPRLDFGAQRVGLFSSRQLLLRNQGSLPVELTAARDSSLRISQGSRLRLAPGETRALDLSYAPPARGAQADTLSWRTPGGIALLQVPLAGEGLAPDLRLSAAALDFGTVPVGGEGRQVLSLGNPGTAPLQYRLELKGAYRLLSAGAGQLAPGAAIQASLSFAPAQRRAYADTLFIYSDVPETPVRRVLLGGRGGQPELSGLPSSLDLGLARVGQSRRFRLELRNIGEVDLHLDRVLTGSRSLLSTVRRLSIPPGQTGNLELVFAPRDTSLVQGQITFATDDPARPRVSLPFAGRGSRTYLYAGASRHLFAPTAVGEERFWELEVRNLHLRTALALQAQAEGPFQVLQAPARLEPGARGVIQVEYRPTRAGTSRGRLVLSTDLKESVVIALEGRGQTPTTLSLATPLLREGEFAIPLQLQQARGLSGLSLELALPEELEYLGMEFPQGSLADQPLLLATPGEGGRLALGLSFDQPVSGSGLLGLLRLRQLSPNPSPLVLAVHSAVVRSASGTADTLALPAPLELGTGVAAKPVPASLSLHPPYPNPFNAEVALSYELPQSQSLSLVIYNTAGQQVRTLVLGIQEAGAYQVVWDGRDQEGRLAGSGIYLVSLRTAEGQLSQQLLILH